MSQVVEKRCYMRKGGTTGQGKVSCVAMRVVYINDKVVWQEGVRGDGKLRDEMCGVVWGGLSVCSGQGGLESV